MDFTKEILKYLHDNSKVNIPVEINGFLKNGDFSLVEKKGLLMNLMRDELLHCMGHKSLGNINDRVEQTLENNVITAFLKPKGLSFYKEHYLPKEPMMTIDNSRTINVAKNAGTIQQADAISTLISEQMNYIEKRANIFAQNYFRGQLINDDEIITEVQAELRNIDNALDKVNFLRIILEANAKAYQQHLLTCKKEKCDVAFAHESVTYFLTQELNQLGIRTDNDQFTPEEKDIAESKLDQILSDLQIIKDGQQIIHDELEELKSLFVLGKKKWHQLLLGKTAEMVMSGIISETASKKIISELTPIVQKLL